MSHRSDGNQLEHLRVRLWRNAARDVSFLNSLVPPGGVLLTEMGGSIAQRLVRDAYQSLERRVHL